MQIRFTKMHGAGNQGLTDKDTIRVQTRAGIITPQLTADGRVTVDMGCPVLEPARVPFDASGLQAEPQGQGQRWPLVLADDQATVVMLTVVSMGNPHAVQIVDDVETAPVSHTGPLIENHPRFPQRVNAWSGQPTDSVFMTGPATSVFEGQIELPDTL